LAKSEKPKKPKKEDLILQLQNSLSSEQWGLLTQLTGREPKDTPKAKANFLTNLFHKSRGHSTAKGIGRELQKWMASQISDFTGVPCGKDEEIESRPGGQSGPDVFMSKRVRRMFPFTSECKSGNQWSLPAAIKQCQANLYPDTKWIVVLDRPSQKKQDRIPPVVVIDGEVFFSILKRAGEIQDLDKD
jgi:hypothetical protein